MPAAEARIHTECASRYLTQLCQHVQSIYSKRGQLRHLRPDHRPGHAQSRRPEQPRVEWTQTKGKVAFADTTITLRASQAELTLRAEAGTQQELQQVQELVTGTLARIGRREGLTVAWQPADAEPQPLSASPLRVCGALRGKLS